MNSTIKNFPYFNLKKVIGKRKAEPYLNPYLAGAGLGIVLLLAFVLMGRGLGASGGFTSILTTGVDVVSPEHAKQNEIYSSYLGDDERSPLTDWLVIELLGVVVGGFLSGLFAGRIKKSIEKGPRISSKGRLALAFTGGVLMGFAAKIARGCTSGQALTGGALLSVGSWVFMISIFIGAYAFAYFMRRQWI